MKITDGKRTVEINIMTWNGTGYGPDWAGEYFPKVYLQCYFRVV